MVHLRSVPTYPCTDEDLVALARAGDEQALGELMVAFRAFARSRARAYFLLGAEREDVVQEGVIGLYKAVRDFDPERDSSFAAFADLCVTRQVLTAVRTATRHKHQPLNDYVSAFQPAPSGEAEERRLAEVLPAAPSASDPAEVFLSAERLRAVQAHLDEALSDLEAEVLRRHVEGESYAQIAEHLSRHVKAVDNALQRVKRKLEAHLRTLDEDEGV